MNKKKTEIKMKRNKKKIARLWKKKKSPLQNYCKQVHGICDFLND